MTTKWVSSWSLCSSPSWSSSCRLDLRLDLHRDLRVDKGEDQKQDKRKRRSGSSSRKAAERQQQRKQKKNVCCCRSTGRCGQQGRYDRGFRRDIHEIFLFACPSSPFTLLVLFLCCLFAFWLLMHKGHKRRCKSLTYVKNMCIICKEYVHNMYTHYRVSVLFTYTIIPDHPVRTLTQNMRLIKKLHVHTK